MKPIRDIFRSHAEFDAEGRHVNGTDKQSNHLYGDAYERIFAKEKLCPQCGGYSIGKILTCPTCNNRGTVPFSMRETAELVMEVGVADGACLQAWREVFPNALIVGMDIHHSDKAHGERIEFYLGDQCVQRDCERAAAGRQFDLIVEDATHHLPNTLLTLFYLWPAVRPGGLYVVEEWEHLGGTWPNVVALWPQAEIVETQSPFGNTESLVVFRKPS